VSYVYEIYNITVFVCVSAVSVVSPTYSGESWP